MYSESSLVINVGTPTTFTSLVAVIPFVVVPSLVFVNVYVTCFVLVNVVSTGNPDVV